MPWIKPTQHAALPQNVCHSTVLSSCLQSLALMPQWRWNCPNILLDDGQLNKKIKIACPHCLWPNVLQTDCRLRSIEEHPTCTYRSQPTAWMQPTAPETVRAGLRLQQYSWCSQVHSPSVQNMPEGAKQGGSQAPMESRAPLWATCNRRFAHARSMLSKCKHKVKHYPEVAFVTLHAGMLPQLQQDS